MSSSPFLSHLILEAQGITQEVHDKFSSLTPEQLKMKPSPDRWSIAECLDHLLNTVNLYLPRIEKELQEAEAKQWTERKPFKSGILGGLYAYFLRPENKSKYKSPNIYLPSQSIQDDIVESFIQRHEKLISLMKKAEGLNLVKIKLPSPITKLIRFRLGDCFNILITHDKRHILQASQILSD